MPRLHNADSSEHCLKADDPGVLLRYRRVGRNLLLLRQLSAASSLRLKFVLLPLIAGILHLAKRCKRFPRFCTPMHLPIERSQLIPGHHLQLLITLAADGEPELQDGSILFAERRVTPAQVVVDIAQRGIFAERRLQKRHTTGCLVASHTETTQLVHRDTIGWVDFNLSGVCLIRFLQFSGCPESVAEFLVQAGF